MSFLITNFTLVSGRIGWFSQSSKKCSQEDNSDLGASAASESFGWLHFEIDVLFLRFDSSCKLLVIEITSFVSTNKMHIVCYKAKVRQASDRCKRIFEAVKLAYASITRKSFLSKKLPLLTFGKFLAVFSIVLFLINLMSMTQISLYLLPLLEVM